MRNLFVLLAVSAAIVVGGASAAQCPGVDHSSWFTSEWVYDEWFVSGTSQPLTVELEIDDIGSGTTVQYYTGSSWVTVGGSYSGVGTKTRFTIGGSVHIVYGHDECWEEVQH
jgi:hypothetical protein